MSAPKYPDEKVLVVSRQLFDELGSFQGFSPHADTYLPRFLDKENNYFLARDDAEHDPSHKQIIPYAIFHHEGRFLHYVRGKQSGEKRLASLGSIGIGGHINAEDEEAASLEKDTYLTGVEREVDEELNISADHTQKIVGLINDDATDVGSVHLGVVHLFDLASPEATSNEDTITELAFLSREELTASLDQMETWSQILVQNLDAIMPQL